MGLRAIRQVFAKLRERLLMGTVQTVHEWNQICEFDCRATRCDWEKWDVCKQRLAAELQGQEATSKQSESDIASSGCVPATKCVSTSDVARAVLGVNSCATISNVLVLRAEAPRPLKRTEIHFEDPKQVPASVSSLALALQKSGFDFRAVRNPGVPATDIWLISPLHDGKKILLSCAAIAGEHVDEGAAAQAGSPLNQKQ